ncbi:hypothetical protein O181_132440, partial [Austropuccinia psidii MF-1]|nr:hypothetical protein [Austropuccinia psidii MF-1]
EIICTTQIYLGEDSGTVEYGKKLVHRRNTVPVLPSDSIEFALVNTQMKTSIVFLNKKELGLMKPFSTFSEMQARSVSDS